MPKETFAWIKNRKTYLSHGKTLETNYEKIYKRTGERIEYNHKTLRCEHKYWGKWEKYRQVQRDKGDNTYCITQYWRRCCYRNVQFVCKITLKINEWLGEAKDFPTILKAYYPSENVAHILERQSKIIGVEL